MCYESNCPLISFVVRSNLGALINIKLNIDE